MFYVSWFSSQVWSAITIIQIDTLVVKEESINLIHFQSFSLMKSILCINIENWFKKHVL